jgi:heptosyltransferase I
MPTGRSNKTLKVLDRYIGTALLAPLALGRKETVIPTAVGRIGLMKTAAIGDTLLLAGLIEDVRRTFPAASVILITGEDNRAAANLLPGRIDEHIVVRPKAPFSAIRVVRQARLDVIVDFGSWPRFDALLAAASGARFRLGFRTAGQSRHYGFDRTVDHAQVHERQNYVRLLAELGVRGEAPACILAPRVLRPDQFPPNPYVVLHPWAGGHLHEAREWAADRWLEVADWAQSRGWTTVLSGAPGEAGASATLAAHLRANGAVVADAAGKYSLAELADVLAASQAVVSVNTGVAHLAGMVGARTVSLQGPTSSTRWGPLGPRVRLVNSELPGCGYLNLGFEYAGQRLDCMDGITAQSVIAAAESLLADAADRSPEARAP